MQRSGESMQSGANRKVLRALLDPTPATHARVPEPSVSTQRQGCQGTTPPPTPTSEIHTQTRLFMNVCIHS